ncbi:MAG: 3-deoxy-manno-octulosonate cytidylyltransferase [Kiritimatiellae bacterium]|nr:3-deoxy-manno-octulosonate cytidylyltransferase [Kiritimatiellia bacterium]MDD5520235.1 3-deoxy-manno-octulosonate cytidylyltransferase [Kiritimatiellia bacterium]
MSDKRIIGVIPARWGSTRFPGKSLVSICGKPLIYWVIQRALRARRLDDLLVATDDVRIADAVNETSVRTVITRPDHPSGTDRIAEAIGGMKADVVINIQGDEPLIDPALIDRLASAMLSKKEWDMATAAAPLTDKKELNNPSVVKVIWDKEGRALYFSRSVIPFLRDADVDARALYWRHVGIYAYRARFLRTLVKTPQCTLEKAEKLEQLRALHIGGKILVLKTDRAGIGVDTPADVKYVERELRKAARR